MLLVLDAAMNDYQGRGSHGDDAAPDLSRLSLADRRRLASPQPALAGMGHPPMSPHTPGMNILNQASNVTQLNANNTSFDPSQGVGHDVATADLQQQLMMVPSFLVPPPAPATATVAKTLPQPRPQPSSSSVLMHNRPSSAPVALAQQQRQPSSPQRQQQQQQQQQHQTVVQFSSLRAALFPQGAASSLTLAQNQNSLATSSSMSSVAASVGGGVSPAPQMPQGVPQVQTQQQQARRPSPSYQTQPILQHSQQQLQKQPGYEKKEYYSEDKRSPSSGRVPATRRDGRKLFVGGLPNGVSDLSFLQFFQQYGEVIDSVVLLDRRTKRSRGFGFVTFADPNVAASLLNTIPGRTGLVNIMGKNCEVKASEPKTAEEAQLAHSTINLPPPSHFQPPQGYNPMAQQQQIMFSAGGMPVPPNFNSHGGGLADAATAVGRGHGGDRGAIYSHSTITRTTAGAPPNAGASASSSAMPTVYIQNNFYTLPPGADLPPSHALGGASMLTPEALVQAQQMELMQNGGAVATALGQGTPYTTTTVYSAMQPLYPGPSSGETNTGEEQLQQQPHQQQTKTRGHHLPNSSSGQY